MARIDVDALRRQAMWAKKRAIKHAAEIEAKEKKELEAKARPLARKIIRSIPKQIRSAARKGFNNVPVLNSSEYGSSEYGWRLFKEIASQIQNHYFKQNGLRIYIEKHAPVGMDDYPYYETLVIEFDK